MLPNDKKKGPATETPVKSKVTSSQAMIQDVPTFTALREGTSINLGIVLGLKVFAIDNHVMSDKLFQGVVLPVDKETMGKFDLDMATTRFFHTLSQVVTSIQSMYVPIRLHYSIKFLIFCRRWC